MKSSAAVAPDIEIVRENKSRNTELPLIFIFANVARIKPAISTAGTVSKTNFKVTDRLFRNVSEVNNRM
jgi:hypothetical protein